MLLDGFHVARSHQWCSLVSVTGEAYRIRRGSLSAHWLLARVSACRRSTWRLGFPPPSRRPGLRAWRTPSGGSMKSGQHKVTYSLVDRSSIPLSCNHTVLPNTQAPPCWEMVVSSKDSKQGAEENPICFGLPPEHSMWGRLGQMYVTTGFPFLSIPFRPYPPGLEELRFPHSSWQKLACNVLSFLDYKNLREQISRPESLYGNTS